MSEEDLATVREVLLYAEMRDNSQGLVKIVERVVAPVPGAGEISIEQKRPGAIHINGNQNIGMVVAMRAADEVAKLAADTGIGMAATFNVSTSTGACVATDYSAGLPTASRASKSSMTMFLRFTRSMPTSWNRASTRLTVSVASLR